MILVLAVVVAMVVIGHDLGVSDSTAWMTIVHCFRLWWLGV
jgi:hypothetical protein